MKNVYNNNKQIKLNFNEHTFKFGYNYIEFKKYCVNIGANRAKLSKCFLNFMHPIVFEILIKNKLTTIKTRLQKIMAQSEELIIIL